MGNAATTKKGDPTENGKSFFPLLCLNPPPPFRPGAVVSFSTGPVALGRRPGVGRLGHLINLCLMNICIFYMFDFSKSLPLFCFNPPFDPGQWCPSPLGRRPEVDRVGHLTNQSLMHICIFYIFASYLDTVYIN